MEEDSCSPTTTLNATTITSSNQSTKTTATTAIAAVANTTTNTTNTTTNTTIIPPPEVATTATSPPEVTTTTTSPPPAAAAADTTTTRPPPANTTTTSTSKCNETLPSFTLPRGGIVVSTRIGPIQVGIPPETIKDSMALGLQVPKHFIIPSEPFNRSLGPNMGINMAEFEFPAYFNFFLKRTSVNLIVNSPLMEERVRQVLQETLYGPAVINIEEDFPYNTPKSHLPCLENELNYFRKFGNATITIDMLISFTHFDSSGMAYLSDGQGNLISIEKKKNFYTITDGTKQTVVSDMIELPLPQLHTTVPSWFNFLPPDFGITVLGNSHGFDPVGKTSGYVIWVNGRGIIVDPPPFSSCILMANNIPPVLVDGMIVTHCHADHDAGAFQKILQEGRVTLHTTRTIYGSFLRKYAALSGLGEPFLKKVLDFRAVRIGEWVKIRGASFRFFYSLHSIPCIGFVVEYGGKSIVFSGDHLNDPVKINQLFEENVISEMRKDELLSFPWECDVILHEAGVPPIHTSLKALESLPSEVKKKLYVVHSAVKDIMKGNGLQIAPEGVENTIVIPVKNMENSRAFAVLDLVRKIDLFHNLRISHAYDILQMATYERYSKDAVIVKTGTFGDSFYIIVSGEAQCIIETENLNGEVVPLVKRFIVGDYFGEACLVMKGHLRTADIIAGSEIEVLRYNASDFNWLLKGTGVSERIRRLAISRDCGSWDIVCRNTLFSTLTSAQKTQLELSVEKILFKAGDKIWRKGSPAEFGLFVASGELAFSPTCDTQRSHRKKSTTRISPLVDQASSPSSFGPGAFIADVDALMSDFPLNNASTLHADVDGSLFRISKTYLQSFLNDNPGVLLALTSKKYMI